LLGAVVLMAYYPLLVRVLLTPYIFFFKFYNVMVNSYNHLEMLSSSI